MSFINWGNETPEQREIRKRLEEREFLQRTMAKKIFEARGATSSASAASAGAAGSGASSSLNNYLIATPTEADNSVYIEFEVVAEVEAITQITINWGDGTVDTLQPNRGQFSSYHEYDSIGEYQVRISSNKLKYINYFECRSYIVSGYSEYDWAKFEELTDLYLSEDNYDESDGECKITNISFLSNFPKLTSISLTRFQLITSVDLTQLFQGGCDNLSTVEIEYCGITQLTGSQHFSNLTGLNLWRNQISTMEDVELSDSIESVNLSENSITTVLFSEQTQGITLLLNNNNIAELLTSTINCDVLEIANNELTSFDFSALASNCNEVNLNYNSLTSLNLSNVGSSELTLRANNNQISEITLGPESVNKIKTLYLTENSLDSTAIDDLLITLASTTVTTGTIDVFYQNPTSGRTSASDAAVATLQSLSWSVSIPIAPAEIEFTFKSDTNAFYITRPLNFQNAVVVDWGDGSPSTNMQYDASHTYLKSNSTPITVTISEIVSSTLTAISFQGNYLTELSFAEKLPSQFRHFEISSNYFKLSTFDFLKLNEGMLSIYLQAVGLTEMNTADLPRSLTSLSILSCNQLGAINYLNLPNLTRFEMANYSHVIVPEQLPISLTALFLRYCGISEIDTMDLPPNLINLDISENPISSLNFAGLPSTLQTLGVSNTLLDSLETSELPTGLTELSMSGLELNSIDFTGLPSSLNFLGIHYSTFPFTQLNGNDLPVSLTTLDISGINCTSLINMENLVNLTNLYMISSRINAIDFVPKRVFIALNCDISSITSDFSNMSTTESCLVLMNDLNLTQELVDHVLVSLNNRWTAPGNRSISLTGNNATPSTTGLAAKSSLQARGVQVVTN